MREVFAEAAAIRVWNPESGLADEQMVLCLSDGDIAHERRVREELEYWCEECGCAFRRGDIEDDECPMCGERLHEFDPAEFQYFMDEVAGGVGYEAEDGSFVWNDDNEDYAPESPIAVSHACKI